MAQPSSQNLSNHRRYVPLYHFVLGAMLIALLVRSGSRMASQRSADTAFEFLLVAAVSLTAFYARSFALAAQDRVIRLELRLRMQALAPQLMARFDDLTPGQLTALRFAGDAELPELAQQVLDGRLTRGEDIKRQIRSWKADEFRV